MASTVAVRSAQLGDALRDQRPALLQLVLELGDLGAAAGQQLELALDVGARLVEDLAAPPLARAGRVQLLAARVARLLGLHQRLELVEADAEQRLQAHGLAQALDVLLVVEAVAAGLALAAAAQQPDLLVVADGPRRRARQPGDLADPQAGRGGAHATVSLGRSSETPAPSSAVAASVHSATGMLWMNGASAASESPLETPEKIDSRTLVGTALVTIASTNAIDRTEPVFCSIMRVPPAIPRRCTGTAPIIDAVLGELNMPEPAPLSSSQKAATQYVLPVPSVVMPARLTATTTMPTAASERAPLRSA